MSGKDWYRTLRINITLEKSLPVLGIPSSLSTIRLCHVRLITQHDAKKIEGVNTRTFPSQNHL